MSDPEKTMTYLEEQIPALSCSAVTVVLADTGIWRERAGDRQWRDLRGLSGWFAASGRTNRGTYSR